MSDLEDHSDVAEGPGPNADPKADVDRYIAGDIRASFDVFSYRHAAAILATSFPNELEDLQEALRKFRISRRDIGMPGGNESVMPKKVSEVLRPRGWVESRIQGDLLIRISKFEESWSDGRGKKALLPAEPMTIRNFIDGHKVDYVKGRVAFDMEWNSKDQTFDRDLYALRAFHECGLISAGVLLTRSKSLNPVFETVPQLDKDGKVVAPSVKAKYGASTTWMGKLFYRLNAGRHGGCPILAIGITPHVLDD